MKQAIFEKVGYKPHPKQQMFHDSPARFKVPVCGRRFGKSKMAAMEALAALMDPSRPVRGWIVGPTYDLGEKEFRYIWEGLRALGVLHHIKRKQYNVKMGSMSITMPWGSKVEVKSADHPDGLIGEGLDFLIVSEAAKQKKMVWEKHLRPSLADRRGWAIFPSTPEGYNWYYDIYRNGQNPVMPEWESWNFPSWENPYVYPLGYDDPEIQMQKRSDEDPWFWQELGADFRSFVGKVYGAWRDDVHIMHGYQYNPAWPNYCAFDWGYSNPFVCLDIQISPSDELYVWREYYVPLVPTHEHAKRLAVRQNPPGYAIRCGFGDSADPGAVETLSRLYCPVIADDNAKDWSRGIQRTSEFLDVYEREDGSLASHLYVDSSCKNFIYEIQNYRTVPPAKDDQNPREDPKKYADHAMDALRYLVMHLFELGAKHHLSDVYQEAPPKHLQPVGSVDAEPSEGFFTVNEESVFTLNSTRVF